MNNIGSQAQSTAATAIALAAASKARDAEARAIIAGFNSETATVDQMREYAHAVLRIHPDEVSDGEDIFFRVMVALCLIGAAAGPFVLTKYIDDFKDPGALEYFTAFLVGGIAPAAAMGAVALLFLAIGYVLGFHKAERPDQEK